ncbi:MAG: trypsin-like peptidase domain-containing protein [Candidatus Scalindua sediminis]|nr:trypsin-like peptidase domain-containing protein [Candidatus Scalindua sediminis]
MQISRLLIIITVSALYLFVSGGKTIAAPIPPEVKSVVAFIFIEKESKLIPNGTAFFVGVKNPSDPNILNVCLVTAKHVLYKPNTTEFLDKVYIRLNKKGGGSEVGVIPIKTEGDKKTVFLHIDTSVDIAVIPFLPDQERFNFKVLPDDLITTKDAYKDLKIREGSDVFFTGLFTPYLGAEKNFPVVRFGRVALITEEKIEWQGKLMDLYLIEAGSYGGNSGAPVFFYLGSDREPGSLVVGTPILKLAGVMQGTFLDVQEVKMIETKKTPISLSNMGIAAVVPAYKLHEVLFSDELKEKRGF